MINPLDVTGTSYKRKHPRSAADYVISITAEMGLGANKNSEDHQAPITCIHSMEAEVPEFMRLDSIVMADIGLYRQID